jgi:hypothetical protein
MPAIAEQRIRGEKRMNSADFHTMLDGMEGEPEPHMALIQHGGFSKTRMFVGYRYGFGAKTFPGRILWLSVAGDTATRKNVYPEILKSLNLSCQQGTPVLENGRTAADMSKPKLPMPSKAFRQIKADW